MSGAVVPEAQSEATPEDGEQEKATRAKVAAKLRAAITSTAAMLNDVESGEELITSFIDQAQRSLQEARAELRELSS